jgi:superfamily II DNA helicase RecQ
LAAAETGVKALYTTPETLQHNRKLQAALRDAKANNNICFVTVDEAHCILEWSEFRCVV